LSILVTPPRSRSPRRPSHLCSAVSSLPGRRRSPGRILFGHLPDRIAGIRVALVSLAIEGVGQYPLWTAIA